MGQIEEFVVLADHVASRASEIILPHFRNCVVERKNDGSEVTVADQKAEEEIRRILNRECPSHAVLGEEFGGQIGDDGYSWVVDPIDGTTYFGLGLPMFGTLIGLLHDGEPVVGVIRFPVLGETIFAGRGLGCWRRMDGDQPVMIQVAQDKSLSEAFCSASGVHGSDLADDQAPAVSLKAVVRGARKFRILGDCQQHALLCRGGVELAIDTIMQPWDTAALVPCIREAGGIATSISGDGTAVVTSGSLLAACGPRVHAEAVKLLAV